MKKETQNQACPEDVVIGGHRIGRFEGRMLRRLWRKGKDDRPLNKTLARFQEMHPGLVAAYFAQKGRQEKIWH